MFTIITVVTYVQYNNLICNQYLKKMQVIVVLGIHTLLKLQNYKSIIIQESKALEGIGGGLVPSIWYQFGFPNRARNDPHSLLQKNDAHS